MPLPKPWSLPPKRILDDKEAAELRKRATKLCSLEENGLDKIVDNNIKANRMSTTRVAVYNKEGYEVEGAELQIKQINHDFKFGCSSFLANGFDSDEKNKIYEDIFKDVFNQAVVPFYWKDDEPEKRKYRFEKGSDFRYRRPPADEILDFCERTNCMPKGHNLFWPSTMHGLPAWLKGLSEREIKNEIEKRIHLIAEKYADKIPVFDVTNEFIGTQWGNGLIDGNYDVRIWKLANELFYNDELIINDFHCFFNDHYLGRASALYQQVQKLKANGIRVDGVGIQCHYFHNEDMLCDDEPKKLDAVHMLEMINTYSELDAKIHLSEITIASYDAREEYVKMQETLATNLYKLWFSCEKVDSIVWWNLVDNTAVPAQPNAAFDENYFGGGLLYKDMREKPAMVSLRNLITKEWHTELSAVTDKNGYAQFTGFNGEYEITVKCGNDTKTERIRLNKNTPLTQIILD